MPRRSLQDIIRVMNAEVRRIAENEGPGSAGLTRFIDCTADFRINKNFLVLGVCFQSHEIWTRRVKMAEEDFTVMAEEDFTKAITEAMRGTLTLAGQIEQTRLEKMFPGTIKNVIVIFDQQRAEKVFQVVFKNGHMAEGYESEVRTEFFTAKCTMLYDLPTI